MNKYIQKIAGLMLLQREKPRISQPKRALRY